MSYYFRDSGYPGEDYLIVTKKGKEEGNLPDGIILLGGLMYCSIAFRNWIREAERNGFLWHFCHYGIMSDATTPIQVQKGGVPP